MSAGWNWDSEGQYPEPLGPFSCWVERATARIVATHLLMGFELELYEPRDYAMIYWWVGFLIQAGPLISLAGWLCCSDYALRGANCE